MNKQIRGGVLLSFATAAVTILVNLCYTPLMIRALGKNEYGLYQLVQSVVNYLNLMNFGFSGAYISFFAREKARGDDDSIARLNGMFLRIFVFIAALCLLGGLVMLKNIHLLGSHLTEADYGSRAERGGKFHIGRFYGIYHCERAVCVQAASGYSYKRTDSDAESAVAVPGKGFHRCG